MNVNLNEDWTAYVVGQMHKYKITNAQLAEECTYGDGKHYSAAYLSTVLNGNKVFSTEESKQDTIDNIMSALKRLESRIVNVNGSD